jgi:hypothetical protein
LILTLSVLGVALTSPFPAVAKSDPFLWVCGGYFEKRLDREVASHGIQIYRERFMAKKDGAVRRAVFVFPVAYRVMRDHLRSQTATRFGEAAFVEYPAFDLRGDLPASSGKTASAARSFKAGDQIAALADTGVRLESTAATHMTTKAYNGVPSKKGWSELHMLVLDGAAIVGSDSTLVVTWREDSAESWGTGESGSLLDFGKHRLSARFVTSTEFALMERLGRLYSTPFGLFPLSDSGPLQQDAATWENARQWLENYRAKPEDKHQAVHPGKC